MWHVEEVLEMPRTDFTPREALSQDEAFIVACDSSFALACEYVNLIGHSLREPI